MDAIELRARRATAQLLADRRAATAPELVRRLLAVQAQDLRSARLALRARGAELTAADVDRELTAERSLVVAWLLRGTLHLVGRDDYSWLLALTAPGRATASRRRLAQEGFSEDDAERAVATIGRALGDEGPLTRQELGERLAVAGIRAQGQALPHLLGRAAFAGLVVLGPLRDGAQAYALVEDWLGPGATTAVDRDGALGELARRYLAAHGPALPSDLARWSGLSLRDARTGLGALAGRVVDLGGGLVDLTAREAPPRTLPPRLLPAFDPYVLGWEERAFAVAPEHARRVHPGGGILRPVLTVDGVVAGTWRMRRRHGGIAVSLDPFRPLPPEAAAALDAEAADVARYEAASFRNA